jgi:hypothetical protein
MVVLVAVVAQQFLEQQVLEHLGKEITEELVMVLLHFKAAVAVVLELQAVLLMVMVVLVYQILLLVQLYFMLVAEVVVQIQVQALEVMAVEVQAFYTHLLQAVLQVQLIQEVVAVVEHLKGLLFQAVAEGLE